MPRLQFPATLRNRGPLLDVLAPRLPSGTVLEVASGSGEHGVFFAGALPHVTWQPTDLADEHLASIDAWREGMRNVLPALRLDVCGVWPTGPYAAVFCANMVHIAPWEAAVGLFAGAATVTDLLITYGPYKRGGVHTAQSNATFDASLRARDPSWGVRGIEELEAIAAGFCLREVIEMPANNLTLVWGR